MRFFGGAEERKKKKTAKEAERAVGRPNGAKGELEGQRGEGWQGGSERGFSFICPSKSPQTAK
jgi:hypothetical protein